MDRDLDPAFTQAIGEAPWKLFTKDWKNVLSAQQTMHARQGGPIAFAMDKLQKVFGDRLNLRSIESRLVLPYRVLGEVVQPGCMPSPNTLKSLLYRLQEVAWRKDLLDLDRRARTCILTAAQEAMRLQPVFESSTFFEGDVLTVRGLGMVNVGLVADDWRVRARYVKALARVMELWSPRLWLDVAATARQDRMSYKVFEWLEQQVAIFYCRMLQHELGRRAIAPPRRSNYDPR
ncbi:hypothetical protein BD626DRAFT_574998 [Schizophyllum amplum]|uniref:Uncharacterized protein n=1 Tax=Schizophyllum amplum TaxID=97359 RepID=A0A550BWH0_9AGAR|nr:hypothetical protein BD626DRAFT_574998 [Auriculariopsis ampla]